jgi:tRNA(fMet)-specific endonuclease VapC
MYILDTDTLSHLSAAHPRVLARRNNVPSSEIAITIVTRIEVLQGRFDFLLKAATGQELLRAQFWLDKTIQDLAQVETVIAIDSAAAAEFDRLRQNKKLRKIGRGDLLIAAITLANRATLVTRNQNDFRQVPGLSTENWAD